MSSRSTDQYGYSRRRKSPYMVAIALAIVMFVLVAPEVNEGSAMSPTIEDGQVLVVSKTSYSQKRGLPERGQLVILEKNILDMPLDEIHNVKVIETIMDGKTTYKA